MYSTEHLKLHHLSSRNTGSVTSCSCSNVSAKISRDSPLFHYFNQAKRFPSTLISSMSNWAEQFFGKELLTKDGVKDTASVLKGKSRVGIYFSAHWCPPCRGFTPVLAEFYDTLKGEDENALEIVFVSSDSDDGSFNDYYGTMPWAALPYSNRSGKDALAAKFGVRGIPMFIVVDGADGSIKDAAARNTVAGAQGDTAAALAKWA